VPATSALTNAFDKLDPATQKFVRFIHDQLEPAFKTIQGAAAKGLLPGVEAGSSCCCRCCPASPLRGQGRVRARRDVPAGRQVAEGPLLDQLLRLRREERDPRAAGHLHTSCSTSRPASPGSSRPSLPVTGSVGRGILDLADDFAAFGESAASGKNDSFNGFLAYVQQALPAVVGFIGDLTGVVGEVITVFRPWGDLLLTILDVVAKLIVHLGPTGLAFVLTAVGAVVIAIGGPDQRAHRGVHRPGRRRAVHLPEREAGPRLHRPVPAAQVPRAVGLLHQHRAADPRQDRPRGARRHQGRHQGRRGRDQRPQARARGALRHVQAGRRVHRRARPAAARARPSRRRSTELGGDDRGFIVIVSGIVDAFDACRSSAAPGIWDDIHHYFSLGIHDVLQLVHDFIGTLNSVLGKVGVTIPNFTVPGVFEVTHGSRTDGRNVAAANGIVLPGYAPGVDSIPAMLSPGRGRHGARVRADGRHGLDAPANALAMRGRRGVGGSQHFGVGGVVADITGGLSSLGGAIAGSVVNPLISTAQNAAHRASNATLGAGIFRDMANGTIDLLGDAAKFGAGGVVSPVGLPAAPAFGVGAAATHTTR
jgi:hypothetical protein